MIVNAAPVRVDTYRLWLCSVVLFDCYFGAFGNMDEWWYPLWWDDVLLAFLKSVELHPVFAF